MFLLASTSSLLRLVLHAIEDASVLLHICYLSFVCLVLYIVLIYVLVFVCGFMGLCLCIVWVSGFFVCVCSCVCTAFWAYCLCSRAHKFRFGSIEL